MRILRELNFMIKEPKLLVPNYKIDWEFFKQISEDVKISNKLNKYLKNKSIIIVGPSTNIIGRRKGKFIDSHDIIVRLNKGWKIPVELEKDYGSRTDILWHCMNESPENGGEFKINEKIEYGVKWIVSQFPRNLDYFETDIKRFIDKNKGRINFTAFSDLVYYLNIQLALGTRINVGQAAVIDLLNYDIKSLHVIGFSFFKDGYYGDYERPKIILTHHDIDPQIHLVKLLNENINFLSFDKEILKILEAFEIPKKNIKDSTDQHKIIFENNFISKLIVWNKFLKKTKTFILSILRNNFNK